MDTDSYHTVHIRINCIQTYIAIHARMYAYTKSILTACTYVPTYIHM